MTNIVSQSIIVEIKGEALVVDSRLIAQDLGVEHETFMRTIKKYEPRIESRFGVIRFEIGKPPQGSLGGRPEKFAWLTEDQSLFLMTLSRNTDQVVNCKANLVESFAKARGIIPAQGERIKELELQNSILEKQLALRQVDNEMLKLHGDRVVLALRGMADQIIEKETVVTEVVNVKEKTSVKILTADQLKRAVFDRTGQQLKTGKQFTDLLRESGRDDLLIPVDRPQVYEYVPADKLNEAINVVYGNQRQKLLGES